MASFSVIRTCLQLGWLSHNFAVAGISNSDSTDYTFYFFQENLSQKVFPNTSDHINIIFYIFCAKVSYIYIYVYAEPNSSYFNKVLFNLTNIFHQYFQASNIACKMLSNYLEE